MQKLNSNAIASSAVSVDKLEKKFGDFIAVNKISFNVQRGEVFGFLGPNGAGKSTTIRMLCGIIAPTSGHGQVGGYDIASQQKLIKQNIGYMSQRFSLYSDLTVEENIDFYSGIYRIPTTQKAARKEWVLRMAGLEELRNSLTIDLSGGWKQRLALGCAIIHEPPIVFLDEPTSGVDPIARKKFWELIKTMSQSGVTVFVTTHYMDEAENCDRIAFIYQGAIVALGTPHELKTNFMREDVLRLTVPHAETWLPKIKALAQVRDVALFGAALHIVVRDGAGEMALTNAILVLEKLLQNDGLNRMPASGICYEHEKCYMLTKIQPSLEDVFVSLVENYSRESL